MARIRVARAGDADEIARVHWDSWETTYRGVLPDEVLDERTVEVRRAFWEQLLSDEATVSGVLVSCSEEGAIEGFVACGRERSGTLGAEGEVYAIYVRREWQGRGLRAGIDGGGGRVAARDGMFVAGIVGVSGESGGEVL